MSPRCALPEHLNDKEEIENAFPDDSQYGGFFGNLWKRWNKLVKPTEAWGPRCPKGIGFTFWPPFIMLRQWREVPKVLWATKDGGFWRCESDGKPDLWTADDCPKYFLKSNPGYYLSRNQYWTRSHKQIEWPLFYCQHGYREAGDVIPVGQRADRDGKLKLFYIGAKRDGDKVFWWIAAFAGNCFK